MRKGFEPELICIPEGYFFMGSNSGREDEMPVHKVWLDTFEIAKFQVTNKQYAYFLEATSYPKPPCWTNHRFNHPNQPVIAINWYDAVEYCNWLHETTGARYRLPSEAEWEKAARGAFEGKLYSWGDEPPESLPTYQTRWQEERPEHVGIFESNKFGLFNIGDNVHEWCLDWYEATYYHHSPCISPRGPDSGKRRSSRGGSWRHQIKISRCAARSSLDPTFKYSDYGFRVVKSTY